jgi:TIR domain
MSAQNPRRWRAGMSRIFISHSGTNDAEVLALSNWLIDQGLSFTDDIFVDVAADRGLATGERWEQALRDSASRCEAVLFLLSRAWLASPWCLRAYELAHRLNKRLIGLLLDDLSAGSLPPNITGSWQLVRLAAGGDPVSFRVLMPHSGADTQVTFSRQALALLQRELQRAALDPETFPWPPDDEQQRSPYRGLRPLEAEDAGIFFGRDGLIVETLDRLRGLRDANPPRLLTILAASGAGKSSFLRAGILPRLKRDEGNFLTLPVVRPERAPITGEYGLINAIERANRAHGRTASRGDIATAVAGGAAAVTPILAELAEQAWIVSHLPALEARKPIIVLPIDQGEELFQDEGRAEAAAFLKLLDGLLTVREPAFMALVTIRSDLYEMLQTAPELDGINQHALSLPPMPRGEYRRVIQGPLRRMQWIGRDLEIEPALTDALLDDIESGMGRDALPLLAFTLERLYLEYGAHSRLRLEDYIELGGTRGAIATTVERALTAAAASPQVPQDRAIQLALLRRAYIPWLAGLDPHTGQPRRRTARMSDIPEAARPLIRALVEQRLLVADVAKDSGDITVEPAHEVLLRKWDLLTDWVKEDFAGWVALDRLKRSVRDYAANNRNPDWLVHTGSRLAEAEQFMLDRPDLFRNLTPLEQEYLAECRLRENALRATQNERAAADLAALSAGKPGAAGKGLAVPMRRAEPRPRGTKVFISYRRSDTRHVSGRIFDALAQKFSADEIFFDVDTIPIAVNFRDYVRAAIETSAIVLAVIGRKWIRRSMLKTWLRWALSADDFVLAEIELALEVGVPILPILIDDTPMPAPARLPATIRQIVDLNAATVRAGRDFTSDIRRVIEIVEPLRDQGRGVPTSAASAHPGLSEA